MKWLMDKSEVKEFIKQSLDKSREKHGNLMTITYIEWEMLDDLKKLYPRSRVIKRADKVSNDGTFGVQKCVRG